MEKAIDDFTKVIEEIPPSVKILKALQNNPSDNNIDQLNENVTKFISKFGYLVKYNDNNQSKDTNDDNLTKDIDNNTSEKPLFCIQRDANFQQREKMYQYLDQRHQALDSVHDAILSFCSFYHIKTHQMSADFNISQNTYIIIIEFNNNIDARKIGPYFTINQFKFPIKKIIKPRKKSLKIL